MKTTLLLVLAVLFAASAGNQKSEKMPSQQQHLLELRDMMTGFFSSESQALEDTTRFHIRLCMAPIWNYRNDGYWLYVEQAAYATLDRPYRQRVYHLYPHEDGSNLVSKVFEIEDPLRFAGACHNQQQLEELTFEILIDRPGCELILMRAAKNTFEGSTLPNTCISSWRGATWVSSDVVISPSGLVSWDRGWDDDNNLIWGPENEGYRFDKIND